MAAPFAPSPRCPILLFALCLHPPESGQQSAVTAEEQIQPRRAEGRGGRVLLTLSQPFPWARGHTAQRCGSGVWELGFPHRLSGEGRGGLSGQCRATGRAVQGLGAGVGEASGSGTTATGTDRQHSRLWPQAPGLTQTWGGGSTAQAPPSSSPPALCSLQRPSLFFLHPSLALWAARPGP